MLVTLSWKTVLFLAQAELIVRVTTDNLTFSTLQA